MLIRLSLSLSQTQVALVPGYSTAKMFAPHLAAIGGSTIISSPRSCAPRGTTYPHQMNEIRIARNSFVEHNETNFVTKHIGNLYQTCKKRGDRRLQTSIFQTRRLLVAFYLWRTAFEAF
eukprot:6392772-Amphidinium_carterae.1